MVNRRRRGGQALIELSLIVIFLLFFVFGIIQFGILISTANTLEQLARDSARFAAWNGIKDSTAAGDPDGIVFGQTAGETSTASHLQTLCSQTSIAYGNLTYSITTSVTPPVAGNTVTVTLQYNMLNNMFLPTSFPGLGGFNTNVNYSSTFVIEQ